MGVVFELYTHMEREPLSVEHYMPPLARGSATWASRHEREEMADFLVEPLGFRVTDSVGRTGPRGCGATRITTASALRRRERTCLHHYAFEVESWGAIERYCDHLAFLGKELVWGPGRHGPGRNLFTYTPDLDNAIIEAYADLLVIDDDANYRPIDWSVRGERVLNLWGPQQPDDWRDYGLPILTPASVSTPRVD